MLLKPIPILVGNVIDGSASRMEAVGDIQENAESVVEVEGIVVHELGCGDIREIDI